MVLLLYCGVKCDLLLYCGVTCSFAVVLWHDVLFCYCIVALCVVLLLYCGVICDLLWCCL